MNKNTYDISLSGNIRPPVFVCIDTAGGGASCTAVCSGVYTKSHSLLVRSLQKPTYEAVMAATNADTLLYLASDGRVHLVTPSLFRPFTKSSM